MENGKRMLKKNGKKAFLFPKLKNLIRKIQELEDQLKENPFQKLRTKFK